MRLLPLCILAACVAFPSLATNAAGSICETQQRKMNCVQQTLLNPKLYFVQIGGPIEWSLVRDIEAVLAKGAKLNALEVSSSPGGDVEAAMALGRLFRSQSMGATVFGDCASACVLAIAGPIYRHYSDARIGLHRPYFRDASRSPQEARQRVGTLNARISSYLQEMNVSPRLLEAMNAVPSDEIRWVTPRELTGLGMLEVDPVYEEYSDGKQAAKLGVSRSEFLLRKARHKDCQARYSDNSVEFCACVDRSGYRALGDKWLCDLRNPN
jgi:hypothetical protein